MTDWSKTIYNEFLGELANIMKYGDSEIVQLISNIVNTEVMSRQRKVWESAHKK